jgi:hypothetical protein
MNWANPIQYLRDHLKALKLILYLLMAAAIVFDILIPRHEAHFFGDKIPVFWSVFGLICCILMIRIMKGIAHTWLMKKEDYYG